MLDPDAMIISFCEFESLCEHEKDLLQQKLKLAVRSMQALPSEYGVTYIGSESSKDWIGPTAVPPSQSADPIARTVRTWGQVFGILPVANFCCKTQDTVTPMLALGQTSMSQLILA